MMQFERCLLVKDRHALPCPTDAVTWSVSVTKRYMYCKCWRLLTIGTCSPHWEGDEKPGPVAWILNICVVFGDTCTKIRRYVDNSYSLLKHEVETGTWDCLHSSMNWWSDCEAHEMKCFWYFLTFDKLNSHWSYVM